MRSRQIAQITHKEHSQLLDAIDLVSKATAGIGRRTVWGGSTWLPDQDILRYVGVQVSSLASAVDSFVSGQYRDGFNTVRAAYEGYFLFQLISTGDVFPTEYKVKLGPGDRNILQAKNRFKGEVAAAQVNNDRIAGILRESDKTVTVGWKAAKFVDSASGGEPIFLPRYYECWRGYRPEEHHLSNISAFFQPQWQVLGSARIRQPDSLHRDYYQKLFTFESLLRNLAINGVLNTKATARVKVHYNFLSNFTHSTSSALSDLPNSGRVKNYLNPRKLAAYDHMYAELGLLYVLHISQMYLKHVVFYLRNWRKLRIRAVRSLLSQANQAVEHYSYFWFIHNRPHTYDRYDYANRKSNLFTRHFIRPDQVRDQDVGYYTDPLARLIQQHQPAHELTTGNVYTPNLPCSYVPSIRR